MRCCFSFELRSGSARGHRYYEFNLSEKARAAEVFSNAGDTQKCVSLEEGVGQTV